jgi:dihydrofolate synthase/folylpolyglutamate synthase
MKYKEVVDWLFLQIPNYQHQGGDAYKPGFDRINALLDVLGNPQQRLKTIHVAGTNGKGSVCHIFSAIFQNNGYKTGLFTSPHITDFRERIKINGKLISKDFVVWFVETYQSDILRIQPSFFEITTAMAFLAFEKKNCDIAIIETGLGGRLDATNVILPELSVITSIGLDHTAFLGNTVELIAAEKAGIIKSKTPIIVGYVNDSVYDVIENYAKSKDAPIYRTDPLPSKPEPTDLLGQYQQRNIRTVLLGIELLKFYWSLDDGRTSEAINYVKKLTNFKGRLQLLSDHPKVIADAAHNLEGVESLLSEIRLLDYSNLFIIYGASNDKDWKEILRKMPREATFSFVEFDSKRSVKLEDFKLEAEMIGIQYKLFSNASKALNHSKLNANTNDLILICGSFYLLEKII